jgi:hypothetical protein
VWQQNNFKVKMTYLLMTLPNRPSISGSRWALLLLGHFAPALQEMHNPETGKSVRVK